MKKEFVERYLIANGKYFPSGKLLILGKILEDSSASEYIVNRRFFNPLLFAVISLFIVGFINPFDRLILRDRFWGVLKVIAPFVLIIVYVYRNGLGNSFLYFSQIFIALCVFYGLWLIIDVFTLYWRVKTANYRSVLRVLNVDDGEYFSRQKKGSRNEITSSDHTKSNSNTNFEEWRKNNPSGTLNDFYKKNR